MPEQFLEQGLTPAQTQTQQQEQDSQREQEAQAPQREGAVPAVQAYLGRRPSPSDMGNLLRQLQSQGLLQGEEAAKVRDLLQRNCGNDYTQRAFQGAMQQGAPASAPAMMASHTPTGAGKRPETLQEHRDAGTVRRDFMPGQLSMKLNKALDKWFADKQAIFEALDGCNSTEAEFLKSTYQKVFNRDLLKHLEDKLSGADLRRAYTPFGKAGEVGETFGETVSRKFSELGGTITKGASDIYNAEKEGLKVAYDMLSIVQDLGLNPITGEGTVTLDVAKAFFYLAPYLPDHIATMFRVDPSGGGNRVQLYVNLRSKVATIQTAQLGVLGMNYPNFMSQSASLNQVRVQVNNFDPTKPTASGSSAFATMASATLNRPVFTSKPLNQGGARSMVSADLVELGGLSLQAASVANVGSGGPADGLVSNLTFKSAGVKGLRYPGMPPVDLDVQQAGLNFESLWDVLGGQQQEQQADKPAGGELQAAPGVLPPDSRIKISLAGIYGAAALSKGATSAKGGFQSCRVALQRDGQDLAAIDIQGFAAQADAQGRLSGSVQSLSAMGSPELVRALLQSKELQAAPQVRQAMELLQRYGVDPSVGGQATLSDLRFGVDGEQQVAQGNLAAQVEVPGVGSLSVNLDGFKGSAASGGAAVDFRRLEVRLKDAKTGEAAALIIEGQQGALQAGSGAGKVSIPKVNLSGKSAQVASLMAALRSRVKALPPEMQRVLDLVQGYGTALAADGSLELSGVEAQFGADGSASASADLSSAIDLPGVGKIEIQARGVKAQGKGGAPTVSLSGFEAKLISASTRAEAAYIKLEGKAGSGAELLGADSKVTVRGSSRGLASLASGIKSRLGERPELSQVFGAIDRAVPALEGIDASGALEVSGLSLEQKGGELVAKGDLAGRVNAPGLGAIDLKLRGYQGNPADPHSLSFEQFEASLLGPDGKEAAFFAIKAAKDRSDEAGGRGALGFSAEKVELRGGSDSLARMLAAVEGRLSSLPPALSAAFGLAKQYGPALDASAAIELDNTTLGLEGGKPDLRGDMKTRVELPGLGRLNLQLDQFQVAPDTVSFARFASRLEDPQGKQISAVTIDADLDEVQRVAREGGIPQKIKNVKIEGSSEQIQRLLAAMGSKRDELPEPALRAIERTQQVLSNYKFDGSLDLADIALKQEQGRTDLAFNVNLPEGSVLEQALQTGSNVTVDLKGYRGSEDGLSQGFDTLEVALRDAKGRRAAGLRLQGAEFEPGSPDKIAKLGQVTVEGDGRLLAGALTPEFLSSLPPQAAQALTSLKGLKLSGSGGELSAGGGGYTGQFADLSLRGSFALTDPNGDFYTVDNAELKASGPKVSLGSDFKLHELSAPSLGGAVTLKRADDGVAVDAELSAKDVRVEMGPDGKPRSFEASDISAAGDFEAAGIQMAPKEQGHAPSKDEKLAAHDKAAAQAQAGVSLLKEAEVHTSTPVNPGRYGSGLSEIEVANGTTLDVDLVVRDRQIVPGATRVKFSHGLRGPLGIKVGGAYLEEAGSRAVLRANLKGWFDINATKNLVDGKSMSLNLSELVGDVMDHQRKAIESAKPRDEARAEEKAREGEEKLQRRRAEWSEDLQEDEADLNQDLAKIARKRAEWADELARKKASGHDMGRLLEKDRRYQAEWDEKIRRLEEDQGKDRLRMAEKEPRAAGPEGLVSPAGMDPMRTSGSADITLAPQGGKDAELAPGVLLPGKEEIRLSGKASGAGSLSLSADRLEALVFGQRIGAAGLSTGNVQVDMQKNRSTLGGKVSFQSFYLRHLDWRAPDVKDLQRG